MNSSIAAKFARVSQSPLLSDSYIISTDIKSFGLIIGDTDASIEGSDHKAPSFFETFDFDTNVATKILRILNDERNRIIYAIDRHRNGFLFSSPASNANLFAFVKKIDIDCDIAGTIIKERFSDLVDSVSDSKDRSYDNEEYASMHSLVSDISGILSICANNPSDGEDVIRYADRIAEIFSQEEIQSKQIGDLIPHKDHIYPASPIMLVLAFLYMTSAKDGGELSLKIDTVSDAVTIGASIDSRVSHLMPRLEFIQSAMDMRNLSLFYREKENTTEILFVPCYIDDGLYGVKAPIIFKNL